jgi:hypothetical protein
MKSTFYLLALAGALLLGSCGKDEPALSVAPGEYRSGGTIIASGPVTMYTTSGSTTDLNIISRFVVRQSAGGDFPAFAAADVPTTTATTLSVQANKEVQIGEAYMGQASFGRLADITGQQSNYIILTQRDSTLLVVRNTGRCERFANDLLTVRPQQRCLDKFGSSNGVLQVCFYLPQRIIKQVNGQLYIPQLSWWLQQGVGSGRCTNGGSGEWNLFNKAVLPQLAPGDTLLVQERQIELIKQ